MKMRGKILLTLMSGYSDTIRQTDN